LHVRQLQIIALVTVPVDPDNGRLVHRGIEFCDRFAEILQKMETVAEFLFVHRSSPSSIATSNCSRTRNYSGS
jgi:hypothetical protein